MSRTIVQGYAKNESGEIVAVLTDPKAGKDGMSYMKSAEDLGRDIENAEAVNKEVQALKESGAIRDRSQPLPFPQNSLSFDRAVLEKVQNIAADPDQYRKLPTISKANDFVMPNGMKLGDQPEGNQSIDHDVQQYRSFYNADPPPGWKP